MREWRDELRARLAPLRLWPEREAAIVEEVAQHLDDRYRTWRAAGHDHQAAVAAAWRELEEGQMLEREIARIERSQPLELPPPGAPARGRWLTAFWRDLRTAARALRQQPVFTFTVIAALALSIGPTTAVVSFGNWLFWRPLPGVARSSDLAIVSFAQVSGEQINVMDISYPNLDDIRQAMKTATGLAGTAEGQQANLVAGTDLPRIVQMGYVTANLFDLLGVRPVAGRSFVPEDDRWPTEPVAIVGHALAIRIFGSPERAIDKRLTLNQHDYRIVGVAPPGFVGTSTPSLIEVWIPGATWGYVFGSPDNQRYLARGEGLFTSFIARLAPGATFPQLEAELSGLARGLSDAHPQDNRKFAKVSARIDPGLGADTNSRPRLRSMLNVLLTISGVLLVLGCANVANMLVARAIRREQEIAVRRALGASGWRLVQLQLAESWMLAVVGAGLGVTIAIMLKQIIQELVFPGATGIIEPVPIDYRVLAATVGAALAIGTLAGVAPAWMTTRAQGKSLATISASRTSTRAPRLRSTLAIVQLALSLTLLVDALLLITTLHNLRAVDLGFDPENLSTYRVNPQSAGYDVARALVFDRSLMTALEGNRSLGLFTIAERAPFDSRALWRIQPSGAAPTDLLRIDTAGVSHSYFDVLGTRIIRGRAFTPDETFAAQPVDSMPVILNEALARKLFGNTDAINQTVHVPPAGNRSTARDLPVVGVVEDVRWNSFTGEPNLLMYIPLGRTDFAAMRTVVIARSTKPLPEITAAVRGAAAQLDRMLPFSQGQALSVRIDRTLQQQRLFATMLSWTGVLAFVLAAVGLHGLVAQTAAERRREFGIRLAIGATRGDIARLVARYAVVIGVMGTGVGLVVSRFGVKLVTSLLFGVTALDPVVHTLAILSLIFVVIVACAWPAIRATRVQPVEVLRAE
jgi:putative ABC transport system permease protein